MDPTWGLRVRIKLKTFVSREPRLSISRLPCFPQKRLQIKPRNKASSAERRLISNALPNPSLPLPVSHDVSRGSEGAEGDRKCGSEPESHSNCLRIQSSGRCKFDCSKQDVSLKFRTMMKIETVYIGKHQIGVQLS